MACGTGSPIWVNGKLQYAVYMNHLHQSNYKKYIGGHENHVRNCLSIYLILEFFFTQSKFSKMYEMLLLIQNKYYNSNRQVFF